ncbi:hypothetical protein [Asticcacaulis sp. AC402]|uniref:hypothetical protein n=1 Tax=Asticcacaulis sp. AC402 TaxID=1282361 RepID=UPI0003C3BAFC|nr:hypothetical protein [Asticcacaulis sp. AC402]ESQ76644.1 hypothetical protein ABAC402_02920 [Asticcacaulis sp. AC402]
MNSTARHKVSEDYQAKYYRKTLEIADQIGNLRGMSPWIWKNFRSPHRERPGYRNGLYRKGLLSQT